MEAELPDRVAVIPDKTLRFISFIFFCMLFLYGQASIAQQNPVDSLKKAIEKASEEELIDLHIKLAVSFKSERMYRKALGTFDKVLKMARGKDDTSNINLALNQMGIMHFYLGDYESSINSFERMHEYNKAIGDSTKIAEALNNIGNVHYIRGDFTKAIDYYFQSLRIKEAQSKELEVAKTYFNIANVYKDIGKHEEALNQYNNALELYITAGDSGTIASCYNNIGIVYESLNDFNRALNYYRRAVSIRRILDDSANLATNYINIGSVFTEMNQLDSALFYVNQAMDIARNENRKHSIATLYRNKSALYRQKRQFDSAIENNFKSLDIAEQIGALQLVELNYKDLADIYKAKKDFRKAYQYNVLYNQVKDSIFNKDKNRQVEEIKAQFETEKKEQQIKLLEKEQALSKSEINRQKILIFSGGSVLVLVIFLTFFIYRRYQDKIRANKLLREKNTQISQQKEEITAQRDEIEAQRNQITLQRDNLQNQKTELERVYKELTNSITYARKIQGAALPTSKMLDEVIPEHFILFIPQNIVGGDFYWVTQKDKKNIVVAADCTGHGVPGGFMSMLGMTFLNEIVNKEGITQTNVILDKLRDYVIEALHQEKELGSLKDGLDISVCCLDYDKNRISVSGANNPVFIVKERNSENLPERAISTGKDVLMEVEVDKMPISISYKMRKFSRQEHSLNDIKMIYMASDGYADQFGGEDSRKYMRTSLKKLLLEIFEKPLEEQKKILNEGFLSWKGDNHQNDDVLIMGIRP